MSHPPAPEHLTPLPAEPQTLTQLIEQEEYDELASILTNSDPPLDAAEDVVSILLLVTRLACQAMLQCQAELDWLRLAEAQAQNRLTENRYVLAELAGLITDLKHLKPQALTGSLTTETPPALIVTADPSTPPNTLTNMLGFVRRLVQRQINDAPAAAPILPHPSPAPSDPAVEQPRLVIYCLGPFKAYRDNQLIRRWKGLKGLAIFKYLLLYGASPVPKDVLMDVFWPDAKPDAARRNLHQAIYSIRRTLNDQQPDFQIIRFENDCYQLNPDLTMWIDADEFSRRARTGTDLERRGHLAEALVEYSIAEGLYQNDFLEEDLYDDWTGLKRQHLRDTYLELADRLSEHYLRQAEYTAAMAVCRKTIRLDRCNEAAYRRLMQCYVAQGQRHLAIRQYLTCLEALKEDLNLEPSSETITLYQGLLGA